MGEVQHEQAAGNKKVSLGEAIIKGKCPKCRVGRLFPYGMYNITKFTKCNDTCPHCGQEFETEPGFFYGAMYVGYALNVALIVTTLVAYLVAFPDLSEFVVIGFLVSLIVLLVPFNFRASRILYLYMFGPIKYDPEAANKVDVENLDVDFRKKK